MTTVKGFAGRLHRSPHDNHVKDGLRRFPRKTMGIYRQAYWTGWVQTWRSQDWRLKWRR